MNILNKRVGIVIGHNVHSQGATSADGLMSEYKYNSRIADGIAKVLSEESNHIPVVIRRGSYLDLPGDINNLDVDVVLSLHCNAFNQRTSGTEVLHYDGSTQGTILAGLLQARLIAALGLPDRRVKGRRGDERGGFLLKKTNAPAVIAEPFFIDNALDYTVALEREDEMIRAYVSGLQDYFNLEDT